MSYCYFHARIHRMNKGLNKSPDEPLELPMLEDRSAILIALTQVLNALGSARLGPRAVGQLLYGLQIASQNVERSGRILPPEGVVSFSLTEDGDDLAPKHEICGPAHDCSACNLRDECEASQPQQGDKEEGNRKTGDLPLMVSSGTSLKIFPCAELSVM
jgi:hypothetical protein